MNDQDYYNLGKKFAIECGGEDALCDDGTLEFIFPPALLKGYRETLLAIQLVKQHGIEKFLGANA